MNHHKVLQEEENSADESCRLLEQAYALGFGASASELLAASDGAPPHTRLAQIHIRRLIRNSNARMRENGRCTPATGTELRMHCEALALMLRNRALRANYYDTNLAYESIYSAVVSYYGARERATHKPRRGKPSALTTMEAQQFISELANLWTAYTGRKPHPGGGETEGVNFNHFVVRAFSAVGVKISPYSLPRITRKILT